MNEAKVLKFIDAITCLLQELRSAFVETQPKSEKPEIKSAPTPARGLNPGTWRPRITFDLNGQQKSITELAQMAGCSYFVMHARLKVRTPADAVAMGAADRSRNAMRNRTKLAPEGGRAPKPAKAEQAGTSDHPLRKLAAGTKLAKLKDDASASFNGEAVIPSGVKVQVIAPPSQSPVPSTFGPIGHYLPADTHLAKVYGRGDRPT